MACRRIVVGQQVDPVKAERAKELRRQMTPEEAMLWQQLRANRLQGRHFRRQQVIDGFIVDFYCHAAGLVIEIDGGIHETQTAYDAERDHVLQERGLRVLRFANSQIRQQLSEVLAQIASACEVET